MPGLTEQQQKGPRWRAEPGCSHETGLTLLLGARTPNREQQEETRLWPAKSLVLSPEKHHGLWTRHEYSSTAIRV